MTGDVVNLTHQYDHWWALSINHADGRLPLNTTVPADHGQHLEAANRWLNRARRELAGQWQETDTGWSANLR
jgi:hypothetical protein